MPIRVLLFLFYVYYVLGVPCWVPSLRASDKKQPSLYSGTILGVFVVEALFGAGEYVEYADVGPVARRIS